MHYLMGVLKLPQIASGLHQVCGRTSLSHDEWQRRQSLRISCFVQPGQKPLRGGVQPRYDAIGIDVIVEHIFGTITAVRHRLSVGSPEIPSIQVVFRNSKTTLVHQAMISN